MMRRRSIAVMACAIAVSTTTAAAEGPSMDPGLLAAKTAFINAQKACNVADANDVVADDMLFIHANGILQDKKAFIEFVRACVLSELQFDVNNVRTYGNVAILSGNMPFKTKQGPGGSYVVSEVYVKRNGKWLFASHQSTDASNFTAPRK